ncbi:MAG: hypothetical protein PHI85_05980 [Victivallaceae bacterium]|nr:hypothetical protein [Victivallaceae bacterium]
MLRKILTAWLCAAAFAAFGKSDFSGWEIKNLGDGKGVVTEFTSEDGAVKTPVLITTNNASWLFYVKNLPAEELGAAKKLYFSADVMSNNPDAVRLVIGENDEWGGAMRRMGAVRPEMKPYQWQRLTLELDRIFNDSFFSCGVGIEYKAAGSWVAIENPVISTEPVELPPLPEYDLMVPDEFDRLPDETLRKTAVVLDKMATLEPSLAGDRQFLDATDWLKTTKTDGSTRTFREFTRLRNVYCSTDSSIMPVPSAFEYDHSTVIPDRTVPFTLTLPRNAKDGFVCLIRNNSKHPENFMVKLSGDVAKYAEVFQLLEVDGTPDLPVPMPADAILHLGAEETAGVLVRFTTAEAGNFSGQLTFLPFNPLFPGKILPLTLEVAAVSLPDQLPIKTFHWDYSGAKDPEKLQLLLDGRVNTFHYGDLPKLGKKDIDEDLSSLVEVVRAVKAAAPAGLEPNFIVETWFIRENGGWKKEFEPWLDKLVKTLADEGVDCDHWYLEIYDEDLSPQFLASAKAIKEYNPNVRIFSDCINKEEGVVEKFAPYLDVWCPVAWMLPPYMQGYEFQIEKMRNTPAELWTYACGPVPINPARRFREQPLLAFAMDMKGCCYWTTYFITPRGARNPNDHFGFFYRDRNGKPVESRRWIEWQGGLNDYLLLYLGAKSEKTAALTEQMRAYAEKHLQDADFWQKYTAMRTELIRKLAE